MYPSACLLQLPASVACALTPAHASEQSMVSDNARPEVMLSLHTMLAAEQADAGK